MKTSSFILLILLSLQPLLAQETFPCEDITRVKFKWVDKNTQEPYTGTCESYTYTGALIQRGQFELGMRVGEWKSWYSDGTLKSTETYVNDLLNGVKKVWYQNGQLESEDHYKDAFRQGTYQAWYEDGQLKYKFSFDKGLKTGKYLYYHPNGQLWEEGYFEEDLGVGTWWTYDENGKKIIKSIFENGEMVKEERFD